MSDKPRIPGPPPAPAQPTVDGRRLSITREGERTSSLPHQPALPSSAPPSYTSDPVIVLTAARQLDQPAQAGQLRPPQPAQPLPIQPTPRTSTYGRPPDVHVDVQTAAPRSQDVAQQTLPAVDSAQLVPKPAGRQEDVQLAPAKHTALAERIQRAPKQPRKPKPKTELDERGRYRHTVRLDAKVEQRLQAVAEILGVDLNAAISMCISVHFHRLTKPGSDG